MIRKKERKKEREKERTLRFFGTCTENRSRNRNTFGGSAMGCETLFTALNHFPPSLSRKKPLERISSEFGFPLAKVTIFQSTNLPFGSPFHTFDFRFKTVPVSFGHVCLQWNFVRMTTECSWRFLLYLSSW